MLLCANWELGLKLFASAAEGWASTWVLICAVLELVSKRFASTAEGLGVDLGANLCNFGATCLES